MKALLTILLTICIFSMVQGQTLQTYVYRGEVVDECKVTVVWDTFDLLVVQTLLEYEQYCYNDSTELAYFTMPPYGNMVLYKEDYYNVKKDFPEDVSDIIRIEVEHKDPTFKGFIEWLKTK